MPLVFLFPVILAGLAAIGIPVALHLRRRERERPIRFPSLMFLQQVKITTARRRRVTDLPLLLLRALIIALAVFAFARPVLRPRAAVAAPATARRVVLLIDRSLSMGHRAVWPAARDSARAVINALQADDRVAVVAFDEESALEQPLTLDHAAALAAIDRITPGSRATRFGAGIRAARELLQREADRSGGDVVLVSDLQRSGSIGTAGLTLPAGVHLRTVAVSRGHGNASVTGMTVQRDARTDSSRARLVVSGQLASRDLSAPRSVRATLTVAGRPSGSRDVMLPVTGTATVAFDPVALPVAGARAVVSIDHDSLVADDSYGIMVPPQLTRRVILAVPGDVKPDETLYLERALETGGDPALRIERRSPSLFSPATLHDAIAVILYDVPVPGGASGTALAAWVHDGGGLLAVAGMRDAGRGVTGALLPATVHGSVDRTGAGGGTLGAVAIEHPVFAAFRGSASAPLGTSRFYRYARATPTADAEVLARFDDGLPALLERTEGAGRVLLTTVPLDALSGDFPLQPTYLPYLRAMVLHIAGSASAPLARTTGDAWTVPAILRDPVIRTPSDHLLRPEPGAAVPLVEAGFYTVYDGQPSGDPVAVLAVNPAASESDLTTMDPRDLLVGVSNDTIAAGAATSAALVEAERRQQLWRTLLILVAVALVGETMMASRGWRGAAVRIAGSEGDGR